MGNRYQALFRAIRCWRNIMAMPSQPDPRPEEETVRYDIEAGVAWVYFNRPDKRNCMRRAREPPGLPEWTCWNTSA
jgi:hypothetical protein